ncbi:PREDICTED: SERTA domain-containing protein 1 [Tinamus guttatus]|uniref:SERTA domain-containing protein 1 n=1 Tax=Tinamus guttatus TaxID=94827 RepID=UPI00052EB414|nr:PREDICTED: SERTA domain-containing protein 1 [Tinamus guttatus]
MGVPGRMLKGPRCPGRPRSLRALFVPPSPMLAKGVKRKRAEMEAGEAPAEAVSGGGGPGAPSASLFNISVLKLHRSLRHVEPNLRYLVLVANTLTLDLLGGPSLLDDSLDGIFEDIDTSMYDCDLWAPGSLAGFKAFSSTEEEEEAEGSGRLDMDDLDYLMDVLVGTHGL